MCCTGKLGESKLRAHPLRMAQHVIFSLSQKRRENVYLVLRVERVLVGEGSDNTDCYFKNRPRTRQENEMLRNGLANMADFRQPLAWYIHTYIHTYILT